jgi:hypothetical protein
MTAFFRVETVFVTLFGYRLSHLELTGTVSPAVRAGPLCAARLRGGWRVDGDDHDGAGPRRTLRDDVGAGIRPDVLAGEEVRPRASRWETREFVFIATEQNRLEDELARSCNRLLVCDTDALATAVWQRALPGLRRAGGGRALDRPDGEQVRPWMHRQFEEELRPRAAPHLLLEGPHEVRLARGVAACDRILGPAAPPPGGR